MAFSHTVGEMQTHGLTSFDRLADRMSFPTGHTALTANHVALTKRQVQAKPESFFLRHDGLTVKSATFCCFWISIPPTFFFFARRLMYPSYPQGASRIYAQLFAWHYWYTLYPVLTPHASHLRKMIRRV